MDQTKSIKLWKKRLESAEERRARLDKANERARAKRRMETEEQKKMRLGTKALISSELKQYSFLSSFMIELVVVVI